MIKFYHAPWSRSSSIHWLLEELGSGIHFATHFLGVLARKQVFNGYLGRVTARPAFQRFMAMDAAAMGGRA